MKKSAKVLTIALCLAIGGGVLAACDNGTKPEEKGDKVTVTFYNATGTSSVAQMPVLRTVEIDKGSTVASFTPENYDGYEFVDWFGAPSKNHRFDFSTEITEDIGIYGGFSKFVADTRDYYLVGSGKSPLLIQSNWGKTITDDHKMTKTADKNVYTLTFDLMEGDQFQFAIDTTWANQRGVGYMHTFKLADGTTAFEGEGSVYSESLKTSNIKCLYSGNYTFTLTTYPGDDYYNTSGTNYTEAGKENYNMGTYDTIEWVRNGDPEEELDVVRDYYIKGNKITSWKDMYNAATKMSSDNGVYTLSIYLKKDDEFLFSSTNTAGSTVSAGETYLRSTNLDDASKAYLDETAGKNMVAKASGEYTFTYTEATEKLTVTFDASVTPVATDYYIDGTFADGVADWSGYCFNSDYKLTETEAGSGIYKIEGVTMKADSEFIIQAFKAGSTERGEWGTDSYNGLGSYNYTYVLDEDKVFSAVGGGNSNIKVVTAGTYDITFDSYSKIITIAAHAAA